MKLRLGTRGSKLALAQSGHMADALRAKGHEVELVVVTTKGDVQLDLDLKSQVDKGFFTTELEEKLDALRGEHFGSKADLIKGEESSGMFRFKIRRVYGKN